MTHYWWMHWFWITFLFSCTCTLTLPQIYPNLTSEISTSMPTPNTSEITVKINTSTTIPLLMFPSSSPPTNLSYKSTKKLKLLLSSPKNGSLKSYNTTKEIKNKNASAKAYNASKELNTKNLAVIKTNLTKEDLSEKFTTSAIINFQNETENVTYLGEESNCNQSLVQNSERIGIEEKVLSPETSSSNLSAAGITGITLGCVVVVGMICGVTFFFYRYHRFNRPQVLNDRCSNPDSSGYIDDASIRDNSEEMYSLDNDSFLNSLEAMTIQNYWTDTVKHTKL